MAAELAGWTMQELLIRVATLESVIEIQKGVRLRQQARHKAAQAEAQAEARDLRAEVERMGAELLDTQQAAMQMEDVLGKEIGQLTAQVDAASPPAYEGERVDVSFLADVLASAACTAAKLNPREHWTDICIALKPILRAHLQPPTAPKPAAGGEKANHDFAKQVTGYYARLTCENLCRELAEKEAWQKQLAAANQRADEAERLLTRVHLGELQMLDKRNQLWSDIRVFLTPKESGDEVPVPDSATVGHGVPVEPGVSGVQPAHDHGQHFGSGAAEAADSGGGTVEHRDRQRDQAEQAPAVPEVAQALPADDGERVSPLRQAVTSVILTWHRKNASDAIDEMCEAIAPLLAAQSAELDALRSKIKVLGQGFEDILNCDKNQCDYCEGVAKAYAAIAAKEAKANG